MCGRFTVTCEKEYLEDRFSAKMIGDYRPRYNAAPSQRLPIITNVLSDKIQLYSWGLLPIWWRKVHKGGAGLINLRDDNLRSKKTFVKELENNRCLVLADGFYEWQRVGKKKIPFRIVKMDEKPFAMAGLWQKYVLENGEENIGFAIITTQANKIVNKIHNRMPVILDQPEEKKWLAGSDKNILTKLLNAIADDELEMYQVSEEVNNVVNDNARLLQRM
jgi:putative SOS response-associated peptidase YedK